MCLCCSRCSLTQADSRARDGGQHETRPREQNEGPFATIERKQSAYTQKRARNVLMDALGQGIRLHTQAQVSWNRDARRGADKGGRCKVDGSIFEAREEKNELGIWVTQGGA